MEFYTNRYYKDDRRGYCFLSEKSVFADDVLRRNIEGNIIGMVVGNSTVTAWIGGPVTDIAGKCFYVFGHNKMQAQQTGMDRLSCLYDFVMVPLENLSLIGGVEKIMNTVRSQEGKAFQPGVVTVTSNVVKRESGDRSKIAEAMAWFAIDKTTAFSMAGTPSACEQAINVIWSCSVFPDSVPTVVYLDQSSQMEPKSGWIFRAAQSVPSQQLKHGYTEGRKPPELQYLYEACYALFSNATTGYQTAMTPQRQKQLGEKFGKNNSGLTNQLLMWCYALDHDQRLLPTQEEKKVLLDKIH